MRKKLYTFVKKNNKFLIWSFLYTDDMQLGNVNWAEVDKLTAMPDWAVDKHTFRGKNGKGTKHLVKKKPNAGLYHCTIYNMEKFI